MGCRTNGLSDQWVVGPMGCRTNGLSDHREVTYLNDIGKILKSVLFADDTNFYRSGTDVTDLNVKVCNELAKLKFWLSANKLSLNVEKTNFMVFSKKKINYNFVIKIDDKVIDRVIKTKFLGVLLMKILIGKNMLNSSI